MLIRIFGAIVSLCMLFGCKSTKQLSETEIKKDVHVSETIETIETKQETAKISEINVTSTIIDETVNETFFSIPDSTGKQYVIKKVEKLRTLRILENEELIIENDTNETATSEIVIEANDNSVIETVEITETKKKTLWAWIAIPVLLLVVYVVYKTIRHG